MVNYAFFNDFKGGDTLLFEGTAYDLASFADLLVSVATGTAPKRINLDESTGFAPHRSTLTIIDVVHRRANEVALTKSGDPILASWTLSTSDAMRVAELVRNVAARPRAAHEFLEDSGTIQIIVAKNEYPLGVFEGR